MISRLLLASVAFTLIGMNLSAEDTNALPSAHDMLKARLAEEAKDQSAKPANAAPAPAPITPTATALANEAAKEKNPIVAPNATPTPATTDKPKAKTEPATVMPKMEVNKQRITVLDQKLAKQDEEIAREKKNTKPSELDKALNDSKIAKPLAIFGGESTQFRQHVASERVSLMEDEKDLIEAIAHAKTKEEKAELQKQLDALRAERRELDKALR